MFSEKKKKKKKELTFPIFSVSGMTVNSYRTRTGVITMTCTSDGPVYFNFIQYLPCKRSSTNRARGLAKFVRCNTVSLCRGSFSCISILGCERNRSFYQ